VLRRILRRAMRHAHMMGRDAPLLHRPGARADPPDGRRLPRDPARRGAGDGDRCGSRRRASAGCSNAASACWPEESGELGDRATLPGDVAFRLYDTYGFPLDLTQDALRGEGKSVDVAGFEAAMAEQKRRARAAWAGSGRGRDRDALVRREGSGRRDRVPRLLHRDGGGRDPRHRRGRQAVESAPAGTEVAVVLNQTPFYAESGGQVGDAGLISAGEGCRIVVRDTQKKLGDLFVHYGVVAHGEAKVGLAVQARSTTPAAARSARTIPPPTCCMRRCAGVSARMSRRRAR
jgi:alanyl-tRNA synthetase